MEYRYFTLNKPIKCVSYRLSTPRLNLLSSVFGQCVKHTQGTKIGYDSADLKNAFYQKFKIFNADSIMRNKVGREDGGCNVYCKSGGMVIEGYINFGRIFSCQKTYFRFLMFWQN
jgi:hypothetical protein